MSNTPKEVGSLSEIQITKIIQRTGIQRFIFLSHEEAAPLLGESHKQVVIHWESLIVRTSLVPAKERGFKLFLNQELRKAAQADSGDPIHLRIRRHVGSPEHPLPPLFKQALEEHPAALAQFLAQTTARRNEMIRFVGQAKQEATQLRRIQKCLAILGKHSSSHSH